MDQPQSNIHKIREQLLLDPFNAGLHQELGKLLIKIREFEAAYVALQQAIVLDPADPWSHMWMGNWHFEQSQPTEALREFRVAQDLRLRHPIVHVCLADAYDGVGNIDLADKHYRMAVRIDPTDQTARKNLARWIRLSRKREAGRQSPK